jgi:FkbM family methyltransferase
MTTGKASGFSQRMRAAVKSSPRLYGALLPYVQALRRATRNEAVRNLDKFRAACDAMSSLVDAPFFVKIGANDGVTGDPCSDILLSPGRWKGLLVEPVPYCIARLEANFPDRTRFAIAPLAIGSRDGDATFYYVDERARAALPDLPPYYDQLGSFSRDHIVKHLDGALEPFILERRVPVRRLSGLLDERGITEIHLLHVDVEGFDLEVLKTLDFQKHAPVLIFVEHKHLDDGGRNEMRRLLSGNGYAVRDCGGDFFALHDPRFRAILAREGSGRR